MSGWVKYKRNAIYMTTHESFFLFFLPLAGLPGVCVAELPVPAPLRACLAGAWLCE